MAGPDDSVAITAGSGEDIATNTPADGKNYQAVVVADEFGQILGSLPTWVAATGNLANVAAARTTHVDLFNASGSGVVLKVMGVFVIPTLTAVVGIGLTWELIRTSAVGTGGTTVTPSDYDTATAALPAQVTCRSKPTGGATGTTVTQFINTSSEETVPVE